MAKGRKLTTSRSERYLGGFRGGQATESSAPELREEDVWPVADDGDDRFANGGWSSTDRSQVGGLSLAFDRAASARSIVLQYGVAAAESPRGRSMATSAPVNVPDWSKIYRVNSVESLHDSDDGAEEEAEVVPPHEYLAREYARRRKIAANSVFEGVGRTLKGRDMSRVRDAVWSQTGFDG